MVQRRMTCKDTFDSEVNNLVQKRQNLRPKESLKKQSNVSPKSSLFQVCKRVLTTSTLDPNYKTTKVIIIRKKARNKETNT